MKWINHKYRLIISNCLLIYCWVASPALACGPFFPNTLLGGIEDLLNAPEARFGRELERMRLAPAAHRALPTLGGYPASTLEAELCDLRLALQRQNVASRQIDAILAAHQAERRKIAIFQEGWSSTDESEEGHAKFRLRPQSSRITGALPRATPGLPMEFADYFQGSIAWHAQNISAARQCWETLLARPAADRHFKSTWAAYMLGKSWEEENSRRAAAWFQKVRILAETGFADSLGLAAASLGWEARLHLRDEDYAAAIDRYLRQAATGDRSAIVSLEWTAAKALGNKPAILKRLAAQPQAQRVITAYVISGGWGESLVDVDGFLKERTLQALERASATWPFVPAPTNGWSSLHTWIAPVTLWLEAVESANVRDVAAAEQLALAAYQAGEMAVAKRWLDRSASTPVAQWLRAKLLLREGHLDQAASILAGLAQRFPTLPPDTNRLAGMQLVDSLCLYDSVRQTIVAREQILGELGALRLSRRQYAEALDAMLRAGFWRDAAYVAERVLTVDELKRYVDQHWSETTVTPGSEAENDPDKNPAPPTPGRDLRHLLARRLTREQRGAEARPYFPEPLRVKLDQFLAAMRQAGQERLPAAQRAQAYATAAQIARFDGMELLGTEVEPDFFVDGGAYDLSGLATSRAAEAQSGARALVTHDEAERALRHAPNPDLRFHYRYTAAALAWEAALRMPDQSEATARLLCMAGSWLKVRDPQAADRFYKALVRRCRQTPIGAAAEKLRWFPEMDAEGNLKTSEPLPSTAASMETKVSTAQQVFR